MLKIKDREVREALRTRITLQYAHDPSTLLVEELGLRHGASRVDLAVVNGELHGFEIKSEADTLERLPQQIAYYSAVLDRATLVVSERHAAKAGALIPAWWGVLTASVLKDGNLRLRSARKSRRNPAVDARAVAELLWRPEVVTILGALGLTGRELRLPRSQLYDILVATMSERRLRDIVRQQLKARPHWRDRPQPSSGDDSPPPKPTLSDCP